MGADVYATPQNDSRSSACGEALLVAVEFNDLGLGLIRTKLRKLRHLHLTLGFQGPKASQLYETGINVATVATFAEFGTRDAPARSFLRATMFEHRDKIVRYDGAKTHLDLTVADAGWPGPPRLDAYVQPDPDTAAALIAHLQAHWPG